MNESPFPLSAPPSPEPFDWEEFLARLRELPPDRSVSLAAASRKDPQRIEEAVPGFPHE